MKETYEVPTVETVVKWLKSVKIRDDIDFGLATLHHTEGLRNQILRKYEADIFSEILLLAAKIAKAVINDNIITDETYQPHLKNAHEKVMSIYSMRSGHGTGS